MTAFASATPPPTLSPEIAHAIRFLSVDAIVKAKEGHQGVPLGMAEIASVLYHHHLKHDPEHPQWWDRDRVVLSNGHGSMLLYSLLYLTGYSKISLDQIQSFRELGSHCAGHPEYDPEAGIEVTTGPLGQGIANAMGMAIAESHLRARWGSQLFNHYTYAFVGDGCLQEGIGQEMIALAGHLQLGHLILLFDSNAITDDGATNLSISESVPERFRVAHWQVLEVDGHDMLALSTAIAEAKSDPRPTLLVCHTTIAKGVERLQGQRGGHSGRLFEADADLMRQQLAWPHPPFVIAPDLLAAWRRSADQGRAQRLAWQKRLDALPPAQRTELARIMAGETPASLHEVLMQCRTTLSAGEALGGINSSAAIQDALLDLLPERMMACADLEAPTDHKRRLSSFTATNPSGQYIHCGVREHVMGAMANGLAAHGGIIPMTVTYLAFADYLRPALRMAAMMGLPVKFIFSHDSIGIGKNGPTHQPVEILASLRAIPNMWVMRPADAVEAAECWEAALAHRSGPVCLVFARQILPHLPRTSSLAHDKGTSALDRRPGLTANRSALGAYVLLAARSIPAQVTLLATGSEVSIAVQVRSVLEAQGIATAVVSMPCWELFENQNLAYRLSVLHPGSLRVAIEAAVIQGWERYLGPQDDSEWGSPHAGLSSERFVGMSGYGASGPAESLYTRFGITVEAVVHKVLQQMRRSRSIEAGHSKYFKETES